MTKYVLEDLYAIAVVYNTDLATCESLVTLNNSAAAMGHLLHMLVYDNSPQPQDLKSLDAHTALRCTYFHDPTNPGVSRAYNYGASIATRLQKHFVLLVDQDTSFPVESFERYLTAINTHSANTLFCPILQTSRGIYSPTKYYFRRGFIWSDVQPGVYPFKNRNILNSGLLVSTAAFNKAGGYNEKVELYFSDFDFVNHFAKQNNEMVVIDLVCRHSLSDIDNADIASALRRFKYYVKGSYYTVATATDYIYLFTTIMLRSIKLSWQYKNSAFIKIFFKQYLIAKAN